MNVQEKIDKLLKKIDNAEEWLKENQRIRWSPSETEEIKKRGEQPADFFRILYKLQMLDKMRKYVKVNIRLERSQKWMLDHLFEDWGDILIKRVSKDCLSPEILAIRRNL